MYQPLIKFHPHPAIITQVLCIFVVLGTTIPEITNYPYGCDLLSFYYLCRTRNNFLSNIVSFLRVVICFHFTIFVVLGTTALTIAQATLGCDLLSFYYLCRTRNNLVSRRWYHHPVVICFHFTIFVVLGTTFPDENDVAFLL